MTDAFFCRALHIGLGVRIQCAALIQGSPKKVFAVKRIEAAVRQIKVLSM